MQRFENKVVLVTGGTGGIGRATALAFAREGARVVLTGRREREGHETVDLIRQARGEARFVKADVSFERDVERTVQQTLDTYGRLDHAFNNAGQEQLPQPLAETSEETYDRVMDTNVKGVWLSLRHEIPAILKSGGGAIVNNSSVAGLVGMGRISVYVASKHAVVGLTRSVALEFAQQGVRVNAVAPAAIETPMFERFLTGISREQMAAAHPIGRIGRPEEIAAGVLWLCSPEASFVTGQTLALDGGWTVQ